MAEPTTEPTALTAPVPMPAPVDATLFTAERPVPAIAVVPLVASPVTERPTPTAPPAARPTAARPCVAAPAEVLRTPAAASALAARPRWVAAAVPLRTRGVTCPPATLPAAPRTPETTFRPRIPTDPAAVRVAASNLPLDLPDVAIVGPLLSSVHQGTRGPSSVVVACGGAQNGGHGWVGVGEPVVVGVGG